MMGRTYDKFLRAGIDLTPLGVAPGGEAYFCTPRGYSMIGSEGVDGVHCCFVRGYGETVFAVSPENAASDYVHAVARDFTDFLRLLLACGHGAAIEQCWRMTRGQFKAYLSDNPVTDAQRAVLDNISAKLKLAPMPDAWGHIHELQSSFDYSKIKYSEPELAAQPEPEREPSWAVYFGAPDGEPGKILELDTHFEAFGWSWRALAIYVCHEGLVLHLAQEVPSEDFSAFMRRHGLSFEGERRNYSVAERLCIDAYNPMSLPIDASLTINGVEFASSGVSSTSWISLSGANNHPNRFMEHYGLNPDRCWCCRTLRFPASGIRREEIHTLNMRLEPKPAELPGEPFKAKAGETIVLSHPDSGEKYSLLVEQVRAECLEIADNEEFEYPKNCIVMRYTLTPETDSLSLRDVSAGDSARRRGGGRGCSAVSVIFASNNNGCGYNASSSLYFVPPAAVEWLPVWRVKRGKSLEVRLR